jgi:ArsR family transcriptional regulator
LRRIKIGRYDERVTTETTPRPTVLVRAFRALGDESRLRLLTLLREGEQCVCDLTEATGIAQSLLSFHLRTLKDAGLVVDRREGRWVYYTLNRQALEDLDRAIAALKPAPAAERRGPRRCD